jgi:hypothetical protein
MFDDQSFDAPADLQMPESLVPHKHSADPFACPCCANVLSETLRLTNTDLGEHAKGLPPGQRRANAAPYLVTNAQIITMDSNRPSADTMLVADGKIQWIGKAADMPEANSDLQRLNLKGKVVVPGFVEPHMHLPPLAMLHSFSNIGPNKFDTAAQALQQLGKDAANAPKGEWVVGRQFDPSLQQGPDYLTRQMLDEVSTDHPVFVYNASLHLGYCNSVAIALAGLD